MPSYYDAHVGEYDQKFLSGRERSRDRKERAILGSMLPRRRAKVLDIGCGTGRMTSFLHALGYDVLGVDASPNMLKEARRKHPEIRFELLDIEREKPKEKYDIVNMTRLFFHLRNQEGALKNALSCLNRNGIIIFDFLNRNSLSPLMFSIIGIYNRTPVHFNTIAELERMLGKATVLERRKIGHTGRIFIKAQRS